MEVMGEESLNRLGCEGWGVAVNNGREKWNNTETMLRRSAGLNARDQETGGAGRRKGPVRCELSRENAGSWWPAKDTF